MDTPSSISIPTSAVDPAKRALTDTGDKFYLKIEEGPDAGKVYVDPAKAFPRYLKELGVKAEEVDQYWLEIARYCMNQDLLAIFDGGVHLVILRREEFALRNFEPGLGEIAARSAARAQYERILKKRAILVA